MKSKAINIVLNISKALLVALLIILVVRAFLIEPYTMSTDQMETSLLEGDAIFVDKTAYGIRTPITLLSIPFTFDKIGTMKSYSSAIQLPYSRWFGKKVSRNDVILFNNPVESEKPIDKRTLLVNRCIALPGDTIAYNKGQYTINGKDYITSPDYIERYEFPSLKFDSIKIIANNFSIPIRSARQNGGQISILLSKYETYLLASNNNRIELSKIHDENDIPYQFIVPKEGMTMETTVENINIYKALIIGELGKDVVAVKNDSLYINGVKQNNYTFTGDYYWTIADNSSHALDSRTIGFIPFRNIIGKARWIWYSSQAGNSRWSRCLQSVK